MEKRKSLGVRLVVYFVGVSIIPVLLITIFSYYNISNIVNENNKELLKYNLSQARTALEISVESYENVLFQIYSDDDVLQLIKKINCGEDLVVSKNQLKRILRGYLYAKDYIRDISVITRNGTLVFYDSITGSTTRSSWIPRLGLRPEELYQQYVGQKKAFLMPMGEAEETLNERNYLFHLGHRIVDFNRKNENIGIVIISIDEEMLHDICMRDDNKDAVAYNFIVDQEGKLVSYKDRSLLGSIIIEEGKEKRQAYGEFARKQDIYDGGYVSVDYVHDEKLNWDIVNVSNQREVLGEINRQKRITVTILILSVVILNVLIAFFTRRLTGSIKSMVRIMQSAGEGRLQERVRIDARMPSEVKVIAHQYNATMDQLLESVEKEKWLDRQKKEAEIMALEAQLNPHFLYNTLDTINWIAIGRKEFEISRAITALAKILRYGIDNSNGIVSVREEYEWLKQYLFLQQTRLKDGFESMVEIPAELMEMKVHKLLVQPFVENSFIHGFKNCRRKPVLKIKMEMQGNDKIQIQIEDNGVGMPQDVMRQLNEGVFYETKEKSQIGLKNALYRIRLYYEEEAQVWVESREDAYTKVYVTLPVQEEGGMEAV